MQRPLPRLVLWTAFAVGSAMPCLPSQNATFRPRTAEPFRVLDDQPAGYAVAFVASPATGFAMNELGDVAGTSYQNLGCGSFCLPPQETVAWRDGVRYVLPNLPGFSGLTVTGINRNGWISGFAGIVGTTTRAVVWVPMGNGYQIMDLGNLPGKSISTTAGIDDRGRVVGWSTTASFPPNGAPFVWDLSTGMVNLATFGFPVDIPLAISPGGTVATTFYWYRLDDPTSVSPVAPPPSGFGINGGATAINDVGDQARFLIRVSGQNLAYLHRYHRDGTWQQLSAVPTGSLTTYGVGSIDNRGDITATIASQGVIAYGPDGLAQALGALVSPAYAANVTTRGGAMNNRGEILTQLMIGRSPRLVRMTPLSTCVGNCMRVASLTLTARFVPDPTDPTHCSPSLTAHNEALATIRVTDANGNPLAGAIVSGRYLDDYWTNAPVNGVTDSDGRLTLPFSGPCGVGAIAFLIDGVTKAGYQLDRTTGLLSAWVIPQ